MLQSASRTEFSEVRHGWISASLDADQICLVCRIKIHVSSFRDALSAVLLRRLIRTMYHNSEVLRSDVKTGWTIWVGLEILQFLCFTR